MLNEADIIQSLQNAFPSTAGVVGIGDDAAVIPFDDTESYVISKDILVENRHFRLATTNAADLAHKSLHVNLSDIAAMGAVPFYVLLGIALPSTLQEYWINDFLKAFSAACKKLNLCLIGGDTTASERDFFISVTVLGRAEKKNLKFRSGAKKGDVICVAGSLGLAHAGLIALEKNAQGLDHAKKKTLSPNALVAEGAWLGAQNSVTAMMDVSDGLYIDLKRLLQAAHCGGAIDFEFLQASPTLREACDALKIDARECLLTGGEDYALLMTIDAVAFERLFDQFLKQFGYALMKIGTVTSGDTLELREGGNPIPFTYRPFSHFGEF